jgi:hypothetical protein
MRAIRYRLRVELRHGVRSLLGITLLVAIAGGIVLAGLGAAHRTATAFERMRTATNAWDVLVNPNDGSESTLTVSAIRQLPDVERVGKVDGIILYPSFAGSVASAFSLAPMLVADHAAMHAVGRPAITDGREPSAGDPNGVLVERTFAQQMHLHVGDRFSYTIMTPELLMQMQSSGSDAAATAVLRDASATLRGRARIDGIGVAQDGVVVNQGYVPAGIIFTPAFEAAHPQLQSAYWGAMVRLRPGADVDAFTRRVQALVPGQSIAFEHASAVAAEVQSATDPEVLALVLFSGLVALLGTVVIGQAVSRRLQVEAAANETWAALGATRRQRAMAAWSQLALAVVVGAVVAVALAIAASPVGPVGVVRIVEPVPGVAVDGLVLGLGALAIVVVGLLATAWPAWRWARVEHGEHAPRRSRVAALASAAGGSVAAVVGLRFALERPSGRAGVPVRATLVAAVTAVALVTAVVVFSGSLDHLIATPRLFGSAWDAQVELGDLNNPNGFGDTSPSAMSKIQSQFMHVVDHSGAVAASAFVPIGEVRSGSVSLPAIGFARRTGEIAPTIAAGRAPRSADEVALGSTTMAHLHTAIGRTVRIARADGTATTAMTVVGRAVLPGLAPYPGSDKAGLGTGAVFTVAGWRAHSQDFQKEEYVFRWADGGSTRALTRAFAREMPSQLPLAVSAVNRPAGIVSAERLRSTPTLLVSLVVVLLVVAVINALMVTIRRRQRDLALLRTLGSTSGQLVRAVLWQASTIGAVAVVVGVPAGVVAGRLGWDVLADGLGAIAVPEVSVTAMVVIGMAVLLLANLVGLLPGLRAARRSPGVALRVE